MLCRSYGHLPVRSSYSYPTGFVTYFNRRDSESSLDSYRFKVSLDSEIPLKDSEIPERFLRKILRFRG